MRLFTGSHSINELRFYTGSLRRLPDQRPLGTRCIIDRRPRTFTAAAQRMLDLLAQVEHRLLDWQEGCLVRPRNGLWLLQNA